MQRLTHLVHHKRNKNKDNPTHDQSRSFLWCWGNLSHKIPCKHKQRTPLLAESLDTERIASITCDARHIIVVTRDGIIYLWELGKSLKKLSKKARYTNYKNRPESLRKLVSMMRNQLPIVSNFEITKPDHSNALIRADLSPRLNKRIFYGSDAVKWLMDHEAASDETESIRFCQSLLNEGRMECALKAQHVHKNEEFKNDRSGLYYFSDSRKKISTSYMQNFHAIPADPTLKFAVVSSNQHYVYAITQDGNLYQWDLAQRSIKLKTRFIQKHEQKKKRKKSDKEDTVTMTRTHSEDYDYDDDESISDPLDSSKECHVESPSTEQSDEMDLKLVLRPEQSESVKQKTDEVDEKHAQSVRDSVQHMASKWIEPRDFFVCDPPPHNDAESVDDDDELPEMLLLEKLSCRPQHIGALRGAMRSVCCGHDFVLALSANGDVFSWGNGYRGKLGLGNENTYHTPQLNSYFSAHKIVINNIACGFDHSLCVTDAGQMYSFGSNRTGKLGIGDTIDYVLRPHRIRILCSKYNSIYHAEYIPSKLLLRDDELLLLDVFTKDREDMWLSDVVIVDIACGYGHNLAVVAGTGQMYSWGANLCGQLGLNDQNDRYLPTAIDAFDINSCKPYNVTSAESQSQSQSLSYDNGNPFDPPPQTHAQQQQQPQQQQQQHATCNIMSVGCGAFHSCALSIAGHVFCWGDNNEGQLGIGDHDINEENRGKLVDYLSGVETTKICCGADFTFAVSDNFVHHQNDYFAPQNDKQLANRKLYYTKHKSKYKLNSFKPPKQPQYRQPGLPLKPRSERRKHEKEISKLQHIFQQKEKSKMNNKFAVFAAAAADSNNNKDKKKEKLRHAVRSRIDHFKRETKKHKFNLKRKDATKKQIEFEEKGYTESDTARAVEFWCRCVQSAADFESQRASPKVRESVWRVGIPTRLRGKVWPLAIGNALNINQTLYELFGSRARQLTRQNSNSGNTNMIGNESSIKYISVDLRRTFPSLSYFQDDGPLNSTLHSLLETYCFFRPDRGYIQGMSYLAANLLLYMDSYTAFVSFANLLNQQFFHSFLSLNDEIIAPRCDIFTQLFEYNVPNIYRIFEEHQIQPKEYFLDWTISLFTKKLPIPVASRVWDIVLIQGEMEVYRCCVAILKCIYCDLDQNAASDDGTAVRKTLKQGPATLKEFQLISTMKTIKVPKKLKQKLQKINHFHNDVFH
eukprot:90150_1